MRPLCLEDGSVGATRMQCVGCQRGHGVAEGEGDEALGGLVDCGIALDGTGATPTLA